MEFKVLFSHDSKQQRYLAVFPVIIPNMNRNYIKYVKDPTPIIYEIIYAN